MVVVDKQRWLEKDEVAVVAAAEVVDSVVHVAVDVEPKAVLVVVR